MSTEERMKILEMIASGKITAEEAARLLDASGRSANDPSTAAETASEAKPEMVSLAERPGLDKTKFSGRRLRVKVVENNGYAISVPVGIIISRRRPRYE